MDCLMKHTKESKRKKDEVDEKLGNDKNTNARAAKTSNAKGRKRRNESTSKGKSEANPEKLISIKIPPTLKKQLVDDCEFITHFGKLVKLPRTPNVNDILQRYLDQRLKKHGSVADSIEEIMKGLGSYFDKALPVILLYKHERNQYQEACPSNTTASSVYGAEHFLRLLVKLPELMSNAGIEKETMTEIQEQTVDFLRFLQRNHNAFFLSTYHVHEDMENKNNKRGE
ncbi:PREDICTED: protein MRG2-like isoform X2 [Lupinus angustifolius]|uniref:protein MRG2-like isoform X2 n=1 Tax=Lupinus angustifolius TaxID=3871 RepID=UPI00092F6A31|nr:PREDICTED: protein MRG2-like isoform X2 [Lupinus angustifolius]